MTMKLYQLWNHNVFRKAYVYQSIYTKFVALATSFILLLLSKFWKKLIAKGRFSPFRWRHRFEYVDIFFWSCWLTIQDSECAISFWKFICQSHHLGIFELLLKFVTLSNSQFFGFQKTRVHNKVISLLRFFKRAQRGYLYEFAICKFANRTSK